MFGLFKNMLQKVSSGKQLLSNFELNKLEHHSPGMNGTHTHAHTQMSTATLTYAAGIHTHISKSCKPIMSAVVYTIAHWHACACTLACVCVHTHSDESWEQSSDNVNCHTRTHIMRAQTHTHGQNKGGQAGKQCSTMLSARDLSLQKEKVSNR